MVTGIDKALMAIIVPLITLAVSRGFLPESEAGIWLELAGAVVTMAAVYLVPNKGAAR